MNLRSRILPLLLLSMAALPACADEDAGPTALTEGELATSATSVHALLGQIKATKDASKRVELATEAAYQIAIDRDFTVRATEGVKDSRLVPSLEGKTYVDVHTDLLAQLAKVKDGELTPKARLVRRTIEAYLRNNVALFESLGFERDFNALFSDAQNLVYLASSFSVEKDSDLTLLVWKYLNVPSFFKWRKELLKRAVNFGVQPTKAVVARQLTQMKEILSSVETNPSDSAFVTSVPLPDAWDEAKKTSARKALASAVKSAIAPGLHTFVDYVETDLLPKARPDLGASATPGGASYYQKCITSQTGQAMTADAVHQAGLLLVKNLEDEIRKIMSADPTLQPLLASSATIGDAIRALPGRVVTSATFDADIHGAMAKVYPANKALWGITAGADPLIEEDVEGTSPYYMQGSADGSLPGTIYAGPGVVIGNYAPTLMHETTHHLQYLATLGQTDAFAKFVRVAWSNATVEGEGLYGELLGSEHGVYSTTDERLQFYGAQIFRAARLVVDTGIHAKGWSRASAVAYLAGHSAETADSVQSEVDRYLSWPGQALGYALGQKVIVELRAELKAKLGTKFDEAAFNRAMLDLGGVPLDVLQQSMRDWAATK